MRSNWSNSEFHQLLSTPEYTRLAGSWYEQRQWGLDAALTALGSHPLRDTLVQAFESQKAYVPNTSGYKQYQPSQLSEFLCGQLGLTFNSTDGSLIGLRNVSSNVNYLGGAGVLGQLLYQTYSQEQYTNFMESYNYLGVSLYRCPSLSCPFLSLYTTQTLLLAIALRGQARCSSWTTGMTLTRSASATAALVSAPGPRPCRPCGTLASRPLVPTPHPV